MLFHDVFDHLCVFKNLLDLFQLDLSLFKVFLFGDFWTSDEGAVAGIFRETKPTVWRLLLASLSVTMLLKFFSSLCSLCPNLGSAEGTGDKHVSEGYQRLHLGLCERLVVPEVLVSCFEVWDVLVHAVDVSPETAMNMSVPSLLKLNPVGVEDDLHGIGWTHDDILHKGLDSLVEASGEELNILLDNLVL